MARPRKHIEDHLRYLELLESTRDSDGVCHRDQAIKLLTEELAAEQDRVFEYAESRAIEVADGFDSSHKPETVNGQMASVWRSPAPCPSTPDSGSTSKRATSPGKPLRGQPRTSIRGSCLPCRTNMAARCGTPSRFSVRASRR